jgi:hypothetical protein
VKIWFTRKVDDQRIALPSYGLPDSLIFSGGRVAVTFPDNPFIRAIALNQDFIPRRAARIKRLLQAQLNGKGQGVLSLANTCITFFIERHAAGSTAIAYQKSAEGGDELKIVDVGTALAPKEISIDSGGLVNAHYSRRGQTISVMTEILLASVIDRPLHVRPLPDDAIALHILGDSGGTTYLATLTGCRCLDFDSSQDNLISLDLSYTGEEESKL